jgi:hypothetical protein
MSRYEDRMKLTFPKSYTLAEVRALYDNYRRSYPDIYEEWVTIERKGRDIEPDDLLDIQTHVYSFLRDRAEWEHSLAPSEVFLDFRRMIVSEHLGYSLYPPRD